MAGRVIFDGVSKRFQRGMAHDSLRDLIPSLIRRVRNGPKPATEVDEGTFWAVRDVSFEVGPGQALGIIGGNGAGKSTTLKLLTKILSPTQGRAEIHGRTGALIEVSAGFHPDLTGRENVFLQGAIMGMPMSLIRERFDEIVEFSGVSAFIDTPIKRYSSGMNARLGFAIAAHLEPDVLIIDEVLSVGDMEFQTRAFGRIKALVKAEIPVVIVSHQLDRIVELCTSCILLRNGTVAYEGLPDRAVNHYLHSVADTRQEGMEHGGMLLTSLTGPLDNQVLSGLPVQFVVGGERLDDGLADPFQVCLRIVEVASNLTLYISDFETMDAHPTKPGPFKQLIEFKANMQPGLYRIETFLWHRGTNRQASEGPTRLFTVDAHLPFQGSHQLSMRKVD